MKQDRYLDFVEEEAKKLGKLFRLDSGEGRDYWDEENQYDVEDLSGWLIAPQDLDRFIKASMAETAYESFSDQYVFAIWQQDENGKISIRFVNYLDFFQR